MASSKPIAAYRTDIKLLLGMAAGSQLSSAELDRALKLAVGTLDRFSPQELVAEFIWDVDITDESFTTPAAADTAAIAAAQTLNGLVDGSTLTLADKTPDVPRRLSVTLIDADASITELTIIVKGYDALGGYIEEYWHLKDLPSATAVQGTKYFKYITEVEVDNIAGTQDVADTIRVGTSNAYDSFISLANKPLKYHSDVVTNAAGTTTYTRDTDYEIDYINGRIKYISGGSMAAGTAYLIDYDLDTTVIDLETLIPDYLEILSVQHVQADKVPTEFESFTIHGRFMWLTTSGGGVLSQDEFGDNDHIRLFYTMPHNMPGDVGGGTFPAYLDELVTYGASGWALVIEALERLHQITTDLASARTELGLTTTDHASAETALDQLQTATTGAYAKISTALGAIPYATIVTTLGNLVTPYTNITTALADLRAATSGPYARIDTALAALVVADTGPYAEITNALNALVVASTGPYARMSTALAKISAILDEVWVAGDTGRLRDAEKVWNVDDPGELMFLVEDADTSAHVDGGAEEMLQVGDSLINMVNLGNQAAALNAEYARVKIAISQQFAQRRRDLVQEAQAFISEAVALIQETQGWVSQANTYLAEAQAWLNKLNGYIAEAQTWAGKANIYLAEAQAWANKALAYISEAQQWLSEANVYIAEAQSWIGKGQLAIAEANTYLTKINAYISEADRYLNTAEMERRSSESMALEGNRRITEYTLALRDRTQMRHSPSWGATRNYS